MNRRDEVTEAAVRQAAVGLLPNPYGTVDETAEHILRALRRAAPPPAQPSEGVENAARLDELAVRTEAVAEQWTGRNRDWLFSIARSMRDEAWTLRRNRALAKEGQAR